MYVTHVTKFGEVLTNSAKIDRDYSLYRNKMTHPFRV